MSLITGTDVVKEYQSGDQTLRALKGIDFAVDPGEFVAIVGPSGSGKSTFLNILGLLDTPTSGVVSLRDENVAELSARQRTDRRSEVIGFIFQSFFLVPTLTARENVEVPRLLEGKPKETTRKAADLLERVGLGERTDHYPDELSGGQKQRVAIARSLINDPDLLLADEPTGNLDRETGDTVLDEFGRITDEGVAVVTVTHDDYVADFADRTVELIDGEIVDRDSPVTGGVPDA